MSWNKPAHRRSLPSPSLESNAKEAATSFGIHLMKSIVRTPTWPLTEPQSKEDASLPKSPFKKKLKNKIQTSLSSPIQPFIQKAATSITTTVSKNSNVSASAAKPEGRNSTCTAATVVSPNTSLSQKSTSPQESKIQSHSSCIAKTERPGLTASGYKLRSRSRTRIIRQNSQKRLSKQKRVRDFKSTSPTDVAEVYEQPEFEDNDDESSPASGDDAPSFPSFISPTEAKKESFLRSSNAQSEKPKLPVLDSKYRDKVRTKTIRQRIKWKQKKVRDSKSTSPADVTQVCGQPELGDNVDESPLPSDDDAPSFPSSTLSKEAKKESFSSSQTTQSEKSKLPVLDSKYRDKIRTKILGKNSLWKPKKTNGYKPTLSQTDDNNVRKQPECGDNNDSLLASDEGVNFDYIGEVSSTGKGKVLTESDKIGSSSKWPEISDYVKHKTNRPSNKICSEPHGRRRSVAFSENVENFGVIHTPTVTFNSKTEEKTLQDKPYSKNPYPISPSNKVISFSSPERARRTVVTFDQKVFSASLPATSTNTTFQSKTSRIKWEEKLYRVKPPHAYPSSVLMTYKELYQEMHKPSETIHRCESLSSSQKDCAVLQNEHTKCASCASQCEDGVGFDYGIGSLQVEVLGCVGLPKLDRLAKPDTAVYLICGDAAFATDMISSCCSPLWPCKSRRAARFPLRHAFARLYVGVFNMREKKKENDDFAGRVVVDLAVLRPNTEYDLTLPLRASSQVYDRRPRGVIRLRFRLHFCSERAAVLSYLCKPSYAKGAINDSVSIPCADVKTFRNVALTLYGIHLPGSFSKRMFRATTREFSLYNIQFQALLKRLAKEVMTWDRPLLSAYLFFGWMRCVYHSSFAMVPPYLVGFLILSMFNNYMAYVVTNKSHCGYSSLTVSEIILSLFCGVANSEKASMQPLNIKKKTDKLISLSGSSVTTTKTAQTNGNEVALVDHMEFPFSERNAYRKLSVKSALVPKVRCSNAKGLTEHKLNRLSIHCIPHKTDSEDDDSDEEMDEDDESVDSIEESEHGNIGDLPFESDGDKYTPLLSKSMPVGPQQDNDIILKTQVPFKTQLLLLENRIHNATFRLFDERVCDSASSSLSFQTNEHEYDKESKKLSDEFDKRLGLNKRSSNPITAVTAVYLGPIMRTIKIWLMFVRVGVNISVWKDPYLSFWVLCFLILLFFVLSIFPWRVFLCVVGLICLGPQNMLYQKAIRSLIVFEKQNNPSSSHNAGDLNEVEQDSDTASDVASNDDSRENNSKDDVSTYSNYTMGRMQTFAKKMRFRKKFNDDKPDDILITSSSADEVEVGTKQPVFAGYTAKRVPKETFKTISRRINVPYSRLRKERFYDWPPGPTVSRATPVDILEHAQSDDLISRFMAAEA